MNGISVGNVDHVEIPAKLQTWQAIPWAQKLSHDELIWIAINLGGSYHHASAHSAAIREFGHRALAERNAREGNQPAAERAS